MSNAPITPVWHLRRVANGIARPCRTSSLRAASRSMVGKALRTTSPSGARMTFSVSDSQGFQLTASSRVRHPRSRAPQLREVAPDS